MKVRITYTIETDDPSYMARLYQIEEAMIDWRETLARRPGGGTLRIHRSTSAEDDVDIVDHDNF